MAPDRDPALQDDQQLKNILLRAGAEVSTVGEQGRERSLTPIPEDTARLTLGVRNGSGDPSTGEVKPVTLPPLWRSLGVLPQLRERMTVSTQGP